MFEVLRTATPTDLVLRHAPPFAISFLLAENLFKFKSFALECAAFLLVWFVLDSIVSFFWKKDNSPFGGAPRGQG